MKKTLAIIAVATLAVMGCDSKKVNAAENMPEQMQEQSDGMKNNMMKDHKNMKKDHMEMKKDMEGIKSDHKKMMKDHKDIMDEHKMIMKDHKKMMK